MAQLTPTQKMIKDAFKAINALALHDVPPIDVIEMLAASFEQQAEDHAKISAAHRGTPMGKEYDLRAKDYATAAVALTKIFKKLRQY